MVEQYARYQFDERLAMSMGVQADFEVDKILMTEIPGAENVVKGTQADERSGVDFWVCCKGDHRHGVDLKNREIDYAPRGHDDLALELLSVVEKQIAGWTLRDDRLTESILWLWKDTGRWTLLPFKMLCAVFRENKDKWCSHYRVWTQETVNNNGIRQWRSQCVFVPRTEVWRAIYLKFGGKP